jgi:hypothetical protein
MNMHTSFKQILKEKMGETPTNQGFSSSVQSTDPAHLAYLMGQMRRPTTPITAPRKSYPRPSVRPVRKAHEFTAAQSLAYEFMKSWVHTLENNFSETELKKAYRAAALILHPDRGGRTELFLELKTHHEVLKQIFKKEQTK